MPHREHVYGLGNPHTEQNFLGAPLLGGPAAMDVYVGIPTGAWSSAFASKS